MWNWAEVELDKCGVGRRQSWTNVELGGGRVGQMCSRTGAQLDKCGVGQGHSWTNVE